jgi:hypothetical protein
MPQLQSVQAAMAAKRPPAANERHDTMSCDFCKGRSITQMQPEGAVTIVLQELIGQALIDGRGKQG